jgi:uncharacterized protein YjbI with pentapeptide repeats
MPPITARRAAVRPRVLVGSSSEPRLLEEEVADLLAGSRRVHVQLVGDPGTGKSTALGHLAAVFAGDSQLVLHDEDPPAADVEFLVEVVATQLPQRPGPTGSRAQVWQLAPWSDDDCIDYLRSQHPQYIGRAWQRWRDTPEGHDLRRHPGLCTRLLDRLAASDGEAHALHALRTLQRELGDALPGARHAAWLMFFPMELLARDDGRVRAIASTSSSVREHLRSETSCAMLAADRMVMLARDRNASDLASVRWQRHLTLAIEQLPQWEPSLVAELATSLGEATRDVDRMTLSLLAIAQHGFRPGCRRLENGSWSMLPSIDLHRMTLAGNWHQAHLHGANLRSAILDDCLLMGARLDRADLTAASLRRVRANNLRAHGLQAVDADLEEASLQNARLDGASFAHAHMPLVNLDHGRLTDADFTDANLATATLRHVDLRSVRWRGVRLQFAKLEHCNASETSWPQLDAPCSNWSGADLTGASWPGANLCRATLRDTKLAGVDWSGADLREANLRGASFHLGSARSGLVDSTIASEGSRTGFYTDESLEQQFQAPEAVRKANLTNCDLRGADLTAVDLYLVDLRGAQLDPEQRLQALRCRALLDRQAAG